jgi:hypothetical protein
VKTVIAAALLSVAMLDGCQETGSSDLGVVVEIRKGNNCEIRVAPESDHRGSYGKWLTVPQNQCGKYQVNDKYPKVFP